MVISSIKETVSTPLWLISSSSPFQDNPKYPNWKASVSTALIGVTTACVAVIGACLNILWDFEQDLRKTKVLAVIPSHAKSLPDILVAWESAKETSKFNHVVVTTGDMKIADGLRSFGVDVIVISESCENGFEYCFEALQMQEKKYDSLNFFQSIFLFSPKKKKYHIVINIQGEASHMEPRLMNDIVEIQKERAVLRRRFLESQGKFKEDRVKFIDLKLHENGYEIKVVNGAQEDIRKELSLMR